MLKTILHVVTVARENSEGRNRGPRHVTEHGKGRRDVSFMDRDRDVYLDARARTAEQLAPAFTRTEEHSRPVSGGETMYRRVRTCSGVTPDIGDSDADCLKEIELGVIALINREFPRAKWEGRG
jgi:hypothetical protein